MPLPESDLSVISSPIDEGCPVHLTTSRMTRKFFEEKTFSNSFSDIIIDDTPSAKTGDVIRDFRIRNYYFSHSQRRLSVQALLEIKKSKNSC